MVIKMQNIKIIDVRALPGDSAFLIDTGGQTILYDTGFAFTGNAVAEKIKSYLGNRNLDYIFLTHSHYDHALGSVYVAKEYPNAKTVAGEYAAKIFAKPTARAVMRDLDRKFAIKNGIDTYEDLIDELRVDIPVIDGDIIKVGDTEFAVINLPGHTKCSVGYYCKELKLLLATETLGVYDGNGGVVPSYLVGYKMSLNSIERVETLDVENILVAHYGLLSGKDAKEYLKAAKQSASDTAEEIAEMLRQGKDKKEIMNFFKDKFYHGYIKTIYPIDAMELNTGIMIDLIERELAFSSGDSPQCGEMSVGQRGRLPSGEGWTNRKVGG